MSEAPGVFDEVENHNLNAIFIEWVVSDEVEDGTVMTKARLGARGYEEDTTNIHKDSPAFSRDM